MTIHSPARMRLCHLQQESASIGGIASFGADELINPSSVYVCLSGPGRILIACCLRKMRDWTAAEVGVRSLPPYELS